MSSEVNLILGQGLAGTALAFRFLWAGEKVIIADNSFKNSSSMVAAGLWNPIVFRRIHLSWMADELIPELEAFYPELEKQLQEKFYFEKDIGRIHGNGLERKLWNEKKTLPEFSPFLGEDFNMDDPSIFVKPHFDASTVHHSGFLDVSKFLEASRAFFRQSEILIDSKVDLPESISDLQAFEIHGQIPKRIIDCRGHKSAESRWWSYLPWGPTKGEVLTIHCPGLNMDHVFNGGFFLFPVGKDTYKLGATFNWDKIDETPSAEAIDELSEKFAKRIKLPFDIIDHKAGIRPTVQDRRPLIGKHPDSAKLFIFNGLGTKGVMLAPYLTSRFCGFLLQGKVLPAEADIDRFSKRNR